MPKVLVFCVALVCLGILVASRKVVDDELIESIRKGGAKWKFGHNQFSHMEREEFVKRLMPLTGRLASVGRNKLKSPRAYSTGIVKNFIPEEFDSRDQWPDCIQPIRIQGQCGSCWAFAATTVLADRQCIATDGAVNVNLSPQNPVSCDANNHGCEGGNEEYSWEYLGTKGTVSEACWPYVSGNTGYVPECVDECTGEGSWTTYHAETYGDMGGAPLSFIMSNIMRYGPMESAFYVFEDFPAYSGGVYRRTSDVFLGGHAIRVVGWGMEDSTPYWLVANSWGTDWGIDGYVKFIRGIDDCYFESLFFAGFGKKLNPVEPYIYAVSPVEIPVSGGYLGVYFDNIDEKIVSRVEVCDVEVDMTTVHFYSPNLEIMVKLNTSHSAGDGVSARLLDAEGTEVYSFAPLDWYERVYWIDVVKGEYILELTNIDDPLELGWNISAFLNKWDESGYCYGNGYAMASDFSYRFNVSGGRPYEMEFIAPELEAGQVCDLVIHTDDGPITYPEAFAVVGGGGVPGQPGQPFLLGTVSSTSIPIGWMPPQN